MDEAYPCYGRACSFAMARAGGKGGGRGAFEPALSRFCPGSGCPRLTLALTGLIPDYSAYGSALGKSTSFSRRPRLRPLCSSRGVVFLYSARGRAVISVEDGFRSLEPRLGVLVGPGIVYNGAGGSVRAFTVIDHCGGMGDRTLSFVSTGDALPELFGRRLVSLRSLGLRREMLHFGHDGCSSCLLKGVFTSLCSRFRRWKCV